MNKCLYCYEKIHEGSQMDQEYHAACSKKIFESERAPSIHYHLHDFQNLALQVIKRQSALTGVQNKISLGKESTSRRSAPDRLTIVGLMGEYILKTPSSTYAELPEIEHLTMRLANLVKITTVPHSLIRLGSGELAYITRRLDRREGNKIHIEDMCQLSEKLTEHKYRGSHEQIARLITRYSDHPGLDKVNYFELVLFCYLTGNSDMHLKNFSLLQDHGKAYTLCPAYDLVSTQLILSEDDEELALTLNGKKRRLKRHDFQTAMYSSGINHAAAKNIFDKFRDLEVLSASIIDKSFLSETMKSRYQQIIRQRSKILEE